MDAQPKLVGYYSRNKVMEYFPNSSRLTYYKPPRHEDVYFDLNRGIESAVRRDYSSGDKRFLFKWIDANHNVIEAPPEAGRWLEPNFVTHSSVLSMLLSAHSSKYNWSIRAAKWRGSIYLSLGHREYSSHYHRRSEEERNKFASWLYKFERYVVSDHADEKPDPSRPVIESDEFKGVYRTQFGVHSVLYDAPLKAVRSEMELQDPLPLENLQFATIRLELQNDYGTKQQLLRRRNIIKWWAIGYLTNSDEFLCGITNTRGIVKKVKTYNMEEIVSEGKFYFNPNAQLDYCKSILSIIAKIVKDDDMIFEVEKVPHVPDLVVRQLSSHWIPELIPAYFLELQ